MFFEKRKSDVKKLKLNNFVFDVKQLKMNKFIFDVNTFTPTRYPTSLKKIQLAFCNPYGGVKTISKESFPYVM